MHTGEEHLDRKRNKWMREALLRELGQEQVQQETGRLMTGFQLVANRLAEIALVGDVKALRETLDRIYGKSTLAPSQPIEKSMPVVASILKH